MNGNKKSPVRKFKVASFWVMVYGLMVFLAGTAKLMIQANVPVSQTNLYSEEISRRGLVYFLTGGNPFYVLVFIAALSLFVLGGLGMWLDKKAEKLVEKRMRMRMKRY